MLANVSQNLIEPCAYLSVHPGSVSSAQKPLKRRRISDSQRQRAEVSCDRCKTRKTRCIRSNPYEACAACAQLKLVCESTAQRKPRTSGSRSEEEISRLETRCRALEALVAQSYPGIDVEDTEAILGLTRHSNPFNGKPPRENGAWRTGTFAAEALARDEEEDSPLPFDNVMSLRIPEGSLIPAPNGAFHYVGPASSYLFANTIRRLVTRSTALPSLLHRNKLRRQQRAADFVSHDRTTALEARVSGHPVTTATSDLDTQESPAAPSPVSYLSPTHNRLFTAPAHRQQLRDALPERPLADRLVKTFFARVHFNMPIFHRGSFQIRYESLWNKAASSSSSSTFSDSVPEPGWICALFMVFVLGAQATDQAQLPASTDLQSRYLSLVIRHGLQRLVLTATLTNVQALLLLSLYQHNVGERNTSWMLLGNATRMAMALGLQRDGENGNFDAIERNVRRMLWWQLQLFEQNMSFELGRPCSTEAIEVTASLPDEDVTDGGDSPPGYLANAISLGHLSLRVKRFVAAYSTEFDKASNLARVVPLAEHLDRQLMEWRLSLPPHLHQGAHAATPKHRRLILMLHTCFHHIRSILGRPYLLCAVHTSLEGTQSTPVSGTMLADTEPAFRVQLMARRALESAGDSLLALLDIAQHELIEGEIWHDFYYGHHASMMLSLPFLVESHLSSDTHRGLVSTFLNLSQRTSLAPTYRILVKVSIQFAKLVGIGPEDDPSRPPSPHLFPREQEATATLPEHSLWHEQRVDQWSETNLQPQTQPLTLEQLLGVGGPVSPIVSSGHGNPPDLDFSDLYNYGFASWLAPKGGGGIGQDDNPIAAAAGVVGDFGGSSTPFGRPSGHSQGASAGGRAWEQDFFGLGSLPETAFAPLNELDLENSWLSGPSGAPGQTSHFNGSSTLDLDARHPEDGG